MVVLLKEEIYRDPISFYMNQNDEDEDASSDDGSDGNDGEEAEEEQ